MDDFTNDEKGWAGWFAELIRTDKHLKRGLHWASSLERTLLLRSKAFTQQHSSGMC